MELHHPPWTNQHDRARQGIPTKTDQLITRRLLSGTAVCGSYNDEKPVYAICGWADPGSAGHLQIFSENRKDDPGVVLRQFRDALLTRD